MTCNIGFRIYTKIARPDRSLVEKFKDLPAANIADEMNRISCMHSRIKAVSAVPLLGTALTVKVRSGDNLMIHKALDMARPGDVVVVDGQGDTTNALAGELMMRQAARAGLGGVVVDGAVRDLDALRELDLAIYAAGATPNGPFKQGPGEINVPVSCGGIVVCPGDILVGDADGVVVIAPDQAEELAKRARNKSHKEQITLREIAAGTRDRSAYSDDAFRKRGCEIVDDFYKR